MALKIGEKIVDNTGSDEIDQTGYTDCVELFPCVI